MYTLTQAASKMGENGYRAKLKKLGIAAIRAQAIRNLQKESGARLPGAAR